VLSSFIASVEATTILTQGGIVSILVFLLLQSAQVLGTPIIIGQYIFIGLESFPTTAQYVEGDPTYIFHPDGGFWGSVPGNTTTDLDAALKNHALTFGVGGQDIT
jgi:hypothetical protein